MLVRIGRDRRYAEMSSEKVLLWAVTEEELTNTGAREIERYTSQFRAGDSSSGGNAVFWGWNMEDREWHGARASLGHLPQPESSHVWTLYIIVGDCTRKKN